MRRKGLVRAADLARLRVSREILPRLHRAGRLERLGRGLYGLRDRRTTLQHSLAEAAKKVPNGVVCLLSALSFHQLTTQAPFEVWMAIDHKARLPKPGPGLAFRFHRFSGKALTAGVERHVVDGVPVRVYGIAKTVADCFKYRNKIGLDVALEALREAYRARKATPEDLHRYARICRVENVMRPYMEALAA
jgi:predicted transcriptional regulator of viral defense system